MTQRLGFGRVGLRQTLSPDSINVLGALTYDADNDRVQLTGSGGLDVNSKPIVNDTIATVRRWEAGQVAIPGTDWTYTTAAIRRTDPDDESIDVINLVNGADRGFGLLGIEVPSWASQVSLTLEYRHAGSETDKVVNITLNSRQAPAGTWAADVATDNLSPPNDTSWTTETLTLTVGEIGWTAGQVHDLQITREATGDTSGEDAYVRAVEVEFA